MKRKVKKHELLKEILLPILIFAVILTVFLTALGNAGRSAESQRRKSLEEAVMRTVVHCYALEGRYPPSVTYMEEVYGLQIDKSAFYVVYDTGGMSNIMPVVRVEKIGD